LSEIKQGNKSDCQCERCLGLSSHSTVPGSNETALVDDLALGVLNADFACAGVEILLVSEVVVLNVRTAHVLAVASALGI
jgi:hypothetical protein